MRQTEGKERGRGRQTHRLSRLANIFERVKKRETKRDREREREEEKQKQRYAKRCFFSWK